MSSHTLSKKRVHISRDWLITARAGSPGEHCFDTLLTIPKVVAGHTQMSPNLAMADDAHFVAIIGDQRHRLF